MRRRLFWPTCLITLLTVTGLRGLGMWPIPASPPPIPVAECGEESEPRMSPAQCRYMQSQTSHWRALMLHH